MTARGTVCTNQTIRIELMIGNAHAEWLVVGAGFTGATVARRLAEECGKKVLLIDGRAHLAGNAYDTRDRNGNLIHRYGPHIFHSNSPRVVAFLSRFTAWRPYEHRVQALIDGRFVPLPFGFKAIDELFPVARAAGLKSKLIEIHGSGATIPVLRLLESLQPDLRELGEYVLEKVFRGYSIKQWGVGPEQLNPSVTARVPILVSYDDRYFRDSFQSMPVSGYTALFERMLNHPNIAVVLNTRYEQLMNAERDLPTVFTGPIDSFFGASHGPLPYRSIEFEYQTVEVPKVQPCGTLNFPSDFDYTRTTELSWVTGDVSQSSVLVREFPCSYEKGRNQPLYPMPTPGSEIIAQAYRREARRARGRVWFAGRLGDYFYYNMDQACARALSLVDKEIIPFLKDR
jgi:UDP-galactopyranose mutase